MVGSAQPKVKQSEKVPTRLVSFSPVDSMNAVELLDQRIQLTSILQSTLDIGEVLKLFLENVGPLLKLDGLSYSNDAPKCQLKLGKQSTHSCGYRLITKEDYLGEVTFKRSARFKEADLETLESMLPNLLNPIRNSLKYMTAVHAASKDPLTGAGNRHAMDSTMKREIELAKRHNQSLSILLIDVDNFKSFNDTYGHLVGDTVLQNLIKKVQEIYRTTDMVFRYGGEEFLVLLNKTDKQGAVIIAERIRSSVQNLIHTADGKVVKFTVSIGISTLAGTDSRASFFDRADKALYRAKNQGRNLVKS